MPDSIWRCKYDEIGNPFEEKEQLLRKSFPAIRARIRRHRSFLLDLAVDSGFFLR
jgi:hypothetical protein